MGQTRFTIHLRYETRALNVMGSLTVTAATGKGVRSGYSELRKKLEDAGFRVTSDGTLDEAWTEQEGACPGTQPSDNGAV